METKFKTTIKCEGCVQTVKPFLNETVGENNWQVDLKDPSRTLTVKGTTESSKVVEALQKAGYQAEKI
jgi:copper chaperone